MNVRARIFTAVSVQAQGPYLTRDSRGQDVDLALVLAEVIAGSGTVMPLGACARLLAGTACTQIQVFCMVPEGPVAEKYFSREMEHAHESTGT